MEIKRDSYLNILISKEHNGLIKVITGMRRCGKSYLLFTLFKEHLLSEGVAEDHIIETAFDAFENKKYRDPDVLYPYLKEQIKDDAMYYVLLDEVQLLGEFESILNSLIRMTNVDVYVTGSNARFLSKDVITEFRGRGDEVHMYPLSFAEFMSVYQGIKQDGWNEYMLYGGNCFLVGLIERNVKRNAAFAERLANKNIERCGQVHAEHSIRGGVQRSSDGRYLYNYTDLLGKRKFIYATDLATLREKERKLIKYQLLSTNETIKALLIS